MKTSAIFFRQIVFGLALALNLPAAFSQTEQQQALVNQLKIVDPTISVRWDVNRSTPAHLAGKLSEAGYSSPEEMTMNFFTDQKDLFHMFNPEEELNIIKVNKGIGDWTHIRLQQMYKALPVEGKMLLVHLNEKSEIRVINSNYFPGIELDTSAVVTQTEAIAAAIHNLGSTKTPATIASPELLIFEFENEVHLCWKIQLYSENPVGEYIYYISAKDGHIVLKYNNLKSVLDRVVFDARNDVLNLDLYVARAEGAGPTGDVQVDAVYEHMGTIYNFFYDNFNRDSYDDDGVIIRSTVHAGENLNQAQWLSGRRLMVFGDGDGVIFDPLCESLDIVAHEFTHAVTDVTAGLVYWFQPGALSESISDIFAVLIDDEDWMIGEDVYTPDIDGDALRYMDKPFLGDQPAHMDLYYETDFEDDSGGVHTNSGIPNKAAYLMAEGGRFYCVSVDGIGRSDMGKVFYEALINWLMPESDFWDVRDATLNAVQVIFPDDKAKYNSVRNAWAAVGIGQPIKNWAGFVSQQIPGTFETPGTQQASVTMRNTSAVAWTPGYKLHSVFPGLFVDEVSIGETVLPGEEVTINFLITAVSSGIYHFQARMEAPFCGGFGDLTPLRIITVGDITDPEACADIENTLAATRNLLKFYQEWLQSAAPSQKPGIIFLIQQTNGQIAALLAQKQQLGCP